MDVSSSAVTFLEEECIVLTYVDLSVSACARSYNKENTFLF